MNLMTRNGKYLIGLVLNLFFALSFYAQEQSGDKTIDSLIVVLSKTKIDTAKVSILNTISLKMSDIDPEKGITYGQKALKLSKKINWKDGIADSYMKIGVNNYELGEIDIANTNYNLALKNTTNKKILAETYKFLSANRMAIADYSAAANYAFKSLRLYESLKDQNGIGAAYTSIATVYFYTEESYKSIFYFKKALRISEALDKKKSMCVDLVGIGSNYEYLYKYEFAMVYYQRALKIATETNFTSMIGNINFGIAKHFLELNQAEKALPYCLEAKKIAILTKNSSLICTSKLLEARIYLALNTKDENSTNSLLLQKAIPLVQDAIKITKKNDNIRVLSESYNTLSEIYSLQNKHKEAKESYVLYVQLQDSIYSQETKESMQNIEDQRVIDKKNAEIKINKISLEAKEKQKWFLVSGLAFLSILGALLYFQNRTRKRNNEKLKLLNSELDAANKAKTRFFSILNHDLRGPVANLAWFLQMQKENPEALDEESKNRIQDKTILGVENLLISMEDMLQWSKSQMENFKPQPRLMNADQLFEDLQVHFSSVDHIKFNYEIDSTVRVTTDENYLKTILRNLTSNAIKALEGIEDPKIVWKAWQANEKTYFSIFDNGKGATNEQLRALYDEKESIGIKSGLGLHLIRDLGKAIDCSISVDSKPNAGTTFVLELNA